MRYGVVIIHRIQYRKIRILHFIYTLQTNWNRAQLEQNLLEKLYSNLYND